MKNACVYMYKDVGVCDKICDVTHAVIKGMGTLIVKHFF